MANRESKVRGRQKRRVYPDGSFSKGMRYTEGFLDGDTSKLLVNYRILDSGSYITPRKGITERTIKVREYTANGDISSTKYPAPHVGFYGVYENAIGEDTHGFIKVSFGVPTSEAYAYYNTTPSDDPELF